MKYKLIIIGAGITGLSTALAWKKAFPGVEKDVLILEKNNISGGCVTTFARKGYRFDTTQIIPDISDLLNFFNLEIPLRKFEGYYARLFTANVGTGDVKIVNIPSSHKGFEEMLCKNYPDDSIAIRKFFGYCRDMYRELNYLKTEPRWYELPGILINCPKIIASSSLTYSEFLNRFGFKNPEVVHVLDTFSSFSGLSGERCAALLTACAMVTTLNGSYRPEKGFIQMPLLMVAKLKQQGVEIRTRCEVQKILSVNNKVTGVQLESGEIIESDFVVCTADTITTYSKLIGEEVLAKANKKFLRKYQSVKMSPSGFSIQLGLDDKINLHELGFNCGYNVLSSGAGSFQKMFKEWDSNRLLMSDYDFHMAVICPSLMTGEKNSLVVHVVPVPSDYWIQLKENNPEQYVVEKNIIAEFYIGKIEKYMIPHLREHIVFTDISTPATYKRYLGSESGSQYDMMPLPSNFGKNRIKTRTPIKGLFVPKFSHGIWPCMQAGLQVLDMITNRGIMNGNSSYQSFINTKH